MSPTERPRAAATNAPAPAAEKVAAALRLSTTRLARRLRTEAEIGLTPMLVRAARSRFGRTVSVLHSAL